MPHDLHYTQEPSPRSDRTAVLAGYGLLLTSVACILVGEACQLYLRWTYTRPPRHLNPGSQVVSFVSDLAVFGAVVYGLAPFALLLTFVPIILLFDARRPWPRLHAKRQLLLLVLIIPAYVSYIRYRGLRVLDWLID